MKQSIDQDHKALISLHSFPVVVLPLHFHPVIPPPLTHSHPLPVFSRTLCVLSLFCCLLLLLLVSNSSRESTPFVRKGEEFLTLSLRCPLRRPAAAAAAGVSACAITCYTKRVLCERTPLSHPLLTCSGGSSSSSRSLHKHTSSKPLCVTSD